MAKAYDKNGIEICVGDIYTFKDKGLNVTCGYEVIEIVSDKSVAVRIPPDGKAVISTRDIEIKKK